MAVKERRERAKRARRRSEGWASVVAAAAMVESAVTTGSVSEERDGGQERGRYLYSAGPLDGLIGDDGGGDGVEGEADGVGGLHVVDGEGGEEEKDG